MRVVASIEARMGSSRLPGKVLADIGGRPALSRLVSRLRQCQRLDGIVVATSTAAADDAVEAWARREQVACYRGSEQDVLQRVVEAHRSQRSELIVEITGDCVLIDPGIVDMAVETFFANRCDVVTTAQTASFPNGTDTQVFPRRLLEEVAANVQDPAVREHVSLHFYEHPERYRVIYLVAPPRWKRPELRLVIDYPEDLQFVREIYRRLEPVHGDCFGIEEILDVLEGEPQLASVNRHCKEKSARLGGAG